MYRCNTCTADRKEFAVPADEVGIELMWAHLQDVHGVLRGMPALPPDQRVESPDDEWWWR